MATVYDTNIPYCRECAYYWGTTDGDVICLFPGTEEEYEEFCPVMREEENANG